jgi:hypothetical protein
LHKQRKVTRSTEGRVEALHFANKSKELDSGLRRNDEKENPSAKADTIPTQPSP